jgi:S-DNA-T family DNA segregation ATPase FtsK/SpoIIIE
MDLLPHCKVAGVTGSGKSEMLKTILYFACRQLPDAEVHIIDLKGGATYAAFERLPQVRAVYVTPEEALEALMRCERIMWQRLAEIRKARRALQKPPQYNLVIVLIDEGGELAPAGANGADKSVRTECMHRLSTLVRIGREPGLRVVYATQRPDKETLPMTVRSQLETTICFRVAEEYDSRIVLGHPGAEKLPHIPGRCIVKTPDWELPVQALYMPPAELERWLREYRDKEVAAGGLETSMSRRAVSWSWE